MANVHDVAAYIVASFANPISTMKLQKLCYMSQGWSLALTGKALFPEEFEAWKNGPVNFELFDEHRGSYSVADWNMGNPGRLSDSDKAVLDGAIRNYGALSGPQLGDLTHRPNTPWSQARSRANATGNSRSRATIKKDDIRQHFSALLGV